MRINLVLILLLASTQLRAASEDDVYRFTTPDGVVHYTDKPPEKHAKPLDLPKLQTFPSGQPPKIFKYNESGATAPKFKVSIDSPTPEQTYRENDATVSVSVSVMPALVGGYGLLYSVNGKPINSSPSSTTIASVPGLGRGSHVIGVALVDAKRQVQANASVTVHVKGSTTRR